jgi:hypothetical protein
LPRRALGRADVARCGEQNVLTRLPLHAVRYAIERNRFGKARIGVATAPVVSFTWFMAAAPPQREGVAIATAAGAAPRGTCYRAALCADPLAPLPTPRLLTIQRSQLIVTEHQKPASLQKDAKDDALTGNAQATRKMTENG